MKRKFLLHYVKELLKPKNEFFCSFALQSFVNEIFQFKLFVLSANYLTLHNEASKSRL